MTVKSKWGRMIFILFALGIYSPAAPALPQANDPGPDYHRGLPETPGLSIPAITGLVPGAVTIPVHATNIVNMGSFQFSLQFDPALMTYTGTSNWFPGISDVMIGKSFPGKLAFIWAGLNNGISIPDSTFFTINFEWLGSSSTSPLNWTDDPTPREFGDYDGVVFYPSFTNGSVTGTTSPPLKLDLADIVIEKDQTVCYNATQIINVAGNGTIFRIRDGGSATLISGQAIHLLPGAAIDSGGYFSGYITTTADYCNIAYPALAQNQMKALKIKTDIPESKSLFTVFPNPTDGKFTLEIFSEKAFQPSLIRVYGPTGECIIAEEITAPSKQLSLEGRQTGLYLISVIQNGKAAATKIFLR
jgi:hypothetical protein